MGNGDERAKQQAKTDRRQDAKLAALTEQIREMQADLAKPDLVEGNNQRLRMHVKTKNTTVTLGHLKGGESYSGFSAQTDGHVFLQARGSPASSYAVIESTGPFLAGSDSDTLMLAKDTAMVGATNNVLVAGRQGVNIVAGAGASWVNDDPDDSDDVPEPEIDAVTHYNTAWTAVGVATTAAMAAWAPVDGAVGKEPIRFKIGSILSASDLAYGMGSSVFNAVSTYTKGPSLGETVNVDATRNVNLNAFQNTSIAGGLGVAIVAPAVNVVGFATASIFGGASAGIGSAGTTAVKGHKRAEVASGQQTVVSTGAKGGDASLVLSSAIQDATLDAGKCIVLNSGGDEGTQVEMTNAGDITTTAAEEARIAVADKYEIKITKKGIAIGIKGGEPVMKIDDSKVEITAPEVVKITGSGGAKLATDKAATVQGSQGVHLKTRKDAKINGKKIKVG